MDGLICSTLRVSQTPKPRAKLLLLNMYIDILSIIVLRDYHLLTTNPAQDCMSFLHMFLGPWFTGVSLITPAGQEATVKPHTRWTGKVTILHTTSSSVGIM